MLNFSGRNLFLYAQFTDMRKSFNSLSALVKNHMELDPTSNSAFIFINKRKNRMKILVFEDSGFWVFAKRLEIGTFDFFPELQKKSIQLSELELQMLLSGLILIESKQLKRYKKKSELF
jgi:transposase